MLHRSGRPSVPRSGAGQRDADACARQRAVRPPCTYLKMDVEGAEREAIAGAEKTIRQYAPKLNIAAYHRSEDFFQLLLLIHALQPSYRLYLRHHPYVPAWDTNLYAI